MSHTEPMVKARRRPWLPPTRRGVELNRVRYVWTNRCTHSDVMSTANTTTILATKVTGSRRKLKLPLSGADGGAFATRSEPVLSLPKARQHRLMVQERDLFMSRLRQERIERSQLENWAAVKLQSVARGFLARPRPVKIEKPRERETEESLKQQLALIAAETDRQIAREAADLEDENIPEWRRHISKRAATKKARKRLKALEKTASVLFQALIRGFLVRRAMRAVWRRAQDEVRRRAATSVQRAWRQFLARRWLEERILRRWFQATIKVQAPFRGMLGRMFASAVRGRMRDMAAQDKSAGMIQRIYRGRAAKKKAQHRRETKAAVRIQKTVRGKKAKNKVTQLKIEKEDEAHRLQEEERIRQEETERAERVRAKREEKATKERAAVRIQSAARGKAAQKSVRNKRRKKKTEHAATKIQSKARQKAAAAEVAKRRKARDEAEQEHAAVAIQKATRSKAARKKVRKRRAEKEEAAKVSAATRIQSQVRRKQADAEVQHARRQKQEALLDAAARPASKKVKRAKKQHAQ